MNSKLKAVIVDDERLARNVLKSHLESFDELTIAGEANNVTSAIEIINKTKPDVVFLDIQMPGETGFDLLEKVKADFQTIFVTAYDKFAIRAFEVNALDYLLKPIKKTRLKKAVERVLTNSATDIKPEQSNYNDNLLLNVDSFVKLIRIKDIVIVTADKDYSIVTLHNGNELRVLKTMKEWEDKLSSDYFGRIHRSKIVNFEFIKSINSHENNSYKIFIEGSPLPVIMSRRYSADLKHKLKF